MDEQRVTITLDRETIERLTIIQEILARSEMKVGGEKREYNRAVANTSLEDTIKEVLNRGMLHMLKQMIKAEVVEESKGLPRIRSTRKFKNPRLVEYDGKDQ